MSTSPGTIKNNNRSKNRDFNIYTEEFFGGSDVFIYVNGKRSHNIAAIQYTVQEQHKPIYGYGSRTFDDLAIGNRIVVGTLKIPVKNPDSSSFSDDWGIDTSTPEIATASLTDAIAVPQWLYNYTPQKANSTIVNENEKVGTVSMVASVQSNLGIEVNGFMDESTRNAINTYRKDNSMILGTLIDNELISSLGIDDYNCYSISGSKVYDSPTLDNEIFLVPKDEKLVFIASEGDIALVRDSSGKAGYININEVYRL